MEEGTGWEGAPKMWRVLWEEKMTGEWRPVEWCESREKRETEEEEAWTVVEGKSPEEKSPLSLRSVR